MPQSAVSSAVVDLAGDLPIRECIAEVLTALDSSPNLVLQAPPGAGKTTVVPLAMVLHDPAYLRHEPPTAPPGLATTSSSEANGRQRQQQQQQKWKKILVLEPRRVAAKAAARRMAATLGEAVGETVGYRVRLETRVGPRTRIEVVTYGILIRMLQSDMELSEVGAILFDEFHERNLDSDLALTLVLDAQQLARPDLRLAVMSATLGGGLAERLSEVMATQDEGRGAGPADVPLVVSEGRSYPVGVQYLGSPVPGRGELERAVSQAVLDALRTDRQGGDILVFLPGVGEINGVERLLDQDSSTRNVAILPLHGNLAPERQDQAIRPKGSAGNQRRIILSTPIAESSVTIDGVTVVVDSGLRRAPVYDVQTGVNRLMLMKVSAASAEQRAGRAGRTGPGTCFRLWDEGDRLAEGTAPEIEDADLAPVVLELALWGSADGSGLSWLDPPNPERVEAAVELLRDLGALRPDSLQPTDEGRQMARFGVHPRYAHMVLRGAELGSAELAAVTAACLSERDILRGTDAGQRSADFSLRLRYLAESTGPWGASGSRGSGGDRTAAKRVLQSAGSILGQLSMATSASGQPASRGGGGTPTAALGALEPVSSSRDETDDDDESSSSEASSLFWSGRASGASSGDPAQAFHAAWTDQMEKDGMVGALLALAFPDRIARRKGDVSDRGSTTFLMADGRLARLPIPNDPLATKGEYLAVAELGGSKQTDRNDNIYVAAALSSTAISRYLGSMLTQRRVVLWASASKKIISREQKRLGALVLEEKQVPASDEEAVPALLKGFKEMGGISNVGLPKDVMAFRERTCWLRAQQLKSLQAARAQGAAEASDGGSGPEPALVPDLSDEALVATAKQWLPPYLMGVRSKADLQRLDWKAILYDLAGGWQRATDVELQVPSHLTMPTGTRVLIDYSREQPTVSVKIQEVFGLLKSPTLAGGRVPVVMELLSPAGKPLQMTSDLAGFWSSSYALVRKDMKGRYPKHYWPEDPAEAEATKLTKKGMARAEEQKQQEQELQGKGQGSLGKKGVSKKR